MKTKKQWHLEQVSSNNIYIIVRKEREQYHTNHIHTLLLMSMVTYIVSRLLTMTHLDSYYNSHIGNWLFLDWHLGIHNDNSHMTWKHYFQQPPLMLT